MNPGTNEPASPRNILPRPVRVTRWQYSAVDLNTGRVRMTELAGPPAAETRAGALADLGLPVDASVLDSPPFYRLSPRAPYQATPEAWMSGEGIDGFTTWLEPVSQDGLIQFSPPQDWVPQPGDRRALHFSSRQLPPFRAMLLTIPITGNSWPGATGHVSVGYVEGAHDQGPPAFQVQVPLPHDGALLWLDVMYTPGTLLDPEFFLQIEAGAQVVDFSHVTLALPAPIAEP